MSELHVASTLLTLLLTFAVLSFLYRDNPLFRLAERIFLGLAVGYWITLLYWDVLRPNLLNILIERSDPVKSWGFALVAALFCALLLTRYFKPVAWVGRLPVALFLGSLAGLGAQGFLRGVLLPQSIATLAPLAGTTAEERALCLQQLTDPGWFDRFACEHGVWVNGLIVLVATVLALLFLFLPRPERRAVRVASRAGYLVLLVGFGVSFGYLVMDRVAVAIGRAEAVLDEPSLAFAALILVVAALAAWRRMRGPGEGGGSHSEQSGRRI